VICGRITKWRSWSILASLDAINTGSLSANPYFFVRYRQGRGVIIIVSNIQIPRPRRIQRRLEGQVGVSQGQTGA